MAIRSEVSMFREIDGQHVFKHTVLVIRGKENELFWATTQLRLNKTSTIGLEKLDKIPINLGSTVDYECSDPQSRPFLDVRMNLRDNILEP
ncbi:hypothetical protein E4U26_000775, partial [Claviceps purpurea]